MRQLTSPYKAVLSLPHKEIRMRCLHFLAVALLVFSCKATTCYISRHAEKAGTMAGDPPLTAEGEKQAQDLSAYLRNKNIGAVYSTKYVRTMATAKPTAERFHLSIITYNAGQSAAFMDSLKTVNKKNVIVVGHSNTVDDMVNSLMGKTVVNDLPETEYGSLFVVKKKGSHYDWQKITVPRATTRQ